MEVKSEPQTIQESKDGRLGKCEVCNFHQARYTCPKCEVKTCRLECARIHKKELNCDGIRDKTKYVPMKQITESDLMSDYIFLESCTNYASARRTDKIKRFTAQNRSLSIPLMKLKKAAAESDRKIKMNFLLPNFDKHKVNKMYYDWTSKVIYWCIEWRFINADNKIVIDERCCETKTMTELITKYFDYNNSISSLACYRSKSLNEIALLLKAEGVPKSQNRYYVIDSSKTLQENLRGKTIVEYPVISVIFDSDVQNYDVIKDDEEDVIDETRKHKDHYFPMAAKHQSKSSKINKDGEHINSNAATADNQKPVNFLFSNENESMDDSTDEEQ